MTDKEIYSETESDNISEIEVSILKEYAESMDEYARDYNNYKFPNSNNKHAAIVLAKILDNCQDRFDIYDDNLAGDIINNTDIVDFEDSMIGFISRGGKSRIIIGTHENEDEELNRTFRVLESAFPNNFEVKLASETFKNAVKEIFIKPLNFAIGDSSRYRLEKSPYTDDRTAEGSFNDREVVSIINKAIEATYHSCEKYFI
jgi:hypothetical protein